MVKIIQMEEIKSNVKNAYSEALFIINNFEPGLYRKVPDKLINFLYNNRNEDYVVKIDLNQSINDQNILVETRALLAIIYRDFICSKEKKIQLIEEDEKYFQENAKKIDDLFNKNKLSKDIEIQVNEDKQVIIAKESFFTKVKNIIRRIFGKKSI